MCVRRRSRPSWTRSCEIAGRALRRAGTPALRTSSSRSRRSAPTPTTSRSSTARRGVQAPTACGRSSFPSSDRSPARLLVSTFFCFANYTNKTKTFADVRTRHHTRADIIVIIEFVIIVRSISSRSCWKVIWLPSIIFFAITNTVSKIYFKLIGVYTCRCSVVRGAI